MRYKQKYDRDPTTNETVDYNGKKFKSGRKPVKLDTKTLERLGREGMPLVHVAAYLGIDRTTIYKSVNLLSAYEMGKAWLVHQLSFIQIQKAMSGDNTWLKILGEQYLGQGDKLTIEHIDKNGLLDLPPDQLKEELKQLKVH